MTETVYAASPELQHPLRFAREAASDLRRSIAPGWQLFLRNVQVRYRRAWLGYLWLLLPTAGTTLVWMYVQSRRIVHIAPTEVAYPLYVLTGTILWQVFVDALQAPLQQLRFSKQLITRTRVPHEALILSGAFEVLLNCAARLVILAILIPIFRTSLTAEMLLAPFGIAALLLFGLALGLLLAPLGLLYDDVSRAIAMVTSFLFFLTPVIYAKPTAGILRLNPITPLLDTTRAWLTSSTPRSSGFAIVTIASLVALAIAWLLHRLARPHVVARLG